MKNIQFPIDQTEDTMSLMNKLSSDSPSKKKIPRNHSGLPVGYISRLQNIYNKYERSPKSSMKSIKKFKIPSTGEDET